MSKGMGSAGKEWVRIERGSRGLWLRRHPPMRRRDHLACDICSLVLRVVASPDYDLFTRASMHRGLEALADDGRLYRMAARAFNQSSESPGAGT